MNDRAEELTEKEKKGRRKGNGKGNEEIADRRRFRRRIAATVLDETDPKGETRVRPLADFSLFEYWRARSPISFSIDGRAIAREET